MYGEAKPIEKTGAGLTDNARAGTTAITAVVP
jgi:hypothetical protein